MFHKIICLRKWQKAYASHLTRHQKCGQSTDSRFKMFGLSPPSALVTVTSGKFTTQAPVPSSAQREEEFGGPVGLLGGSRDNNKCTVLGAAPSTQCALALGPNFQQEP